MRISKQFFLLIFILGLKSCYLKHTRQVKDNYLNIYKNINLLVNGYYRKSIVSPDSPQFYSLSNIPYVASDLTLSYFFNQQDLEIIMRLRFPEFDQEIASKIKSLNMKKENLKHLFLKCSMSMNSKIYQLLLKEPYSFSLDDKYISNDYKAIVTQKKLSFLKKEFILTNKTIDHIKKIYPNLLIQYDIYQGINQFFNEKTWIHCAAQQGDTYMFSILYYHCRANIYIQEKKSKKNILDIAAENRKFNFMKYLSNFLFESQRHKLGNISNSSTKNALFYYISKSDNIYIQYIHLLYSRFDCNLNFKYKNSSFWENRLIAGMVMGSSYNFYYDFLLKKPIEKFKYKANYKIRESIILCKNFPQVDPNDIYKNKLGGPTKFALIEYVNQKLEDQISCKKPKMSNFDFICDILFSLIDIFSVFFYRSNTLEHLVFILFSNLKNIFYVNPKCNIENI